MKHRITYINRAGDTFDPESIHATQESLVIDSVRGAKEHRVTIALSELPEEASCVHTSTQSLLLNDSSSFHLSSTSAMSFISGGLRPMPQQPKAPTNRELLLACTSSLRLEKGKFRAWTSSMVETAFMA